jgi:hypothetical protein
MPGKLSHIAFESLVSIIGNVGIVSQHVAEALITRTTAVFTPVTGASVSQDIIEALVSAYTLDDRAKVSQDIIETLVLATDIAPTSTTTGGTVGFGYAN